MPDYALPLSVSLTREQLTWLDARRRHGSLSRSAALRQVLDGVIHREAFAGDAVRRAPFSAASGGAAVEQDG